MHDKCSFWKTSHLPTLLFCVNCWFPCISFHFMCHYCKIYRLLLCSCKSLMCWVHVVIPGAPAWCVCSCASHMLVFPLFLPSGKYSLCVAGSYHLGMCSFPSSSCDQILTEQLIFRSIPCIWSQLFNRLFWWCWHKGFSLVIVSRSVHTLEEQISFFTKTCHCQLLR